MRRGNSACAFLPLLPLLLFAGAAGAQTKPIAPAPKAPAPLTLAVALTALPPPAQGILLAVGADTVTLPLNGEPPPDGVDLPDLAAAFGQETQTFGSLTAIAPQTRVILNEDPAPPDVTADLNPSTAFKMLAAGLDDTQWAALTSERGLGLSDLTDRTQQALFHALFRRGHLWVASQDPEMAKLPEEQRTDTRDVSDQIGGVRVRLGQTAHLYVHDRAGQTIFFSVKAPDDAKHLHTWSPKQEPPAAQHNVALRAVVANNPKAGDLPLDKAVFQTAVPLAGLRTVDDLVGRIASRTHKEIYADPHHAHRRLSVIGPAPTAPAGDLLSALALAVAGTYRQVGPAFVLTDDLAGVGTRRQRLQEWEDGAFTSSSKLGDQAGAVLLKRRAASARTLPTFGDAVALTPGQMKAMKNDILMPTLPGEDGSYPFAKLTAGQQDLARRTAAAYEEQRAGGTLPSYLADGDAQEADSSGPVALRPQYKVQMLVPTIDSPVETNLQSSMSFLFWPGETALAEQNPEAFRESTPVNLPAAPSLMPLLRSRPRRALIGHPRTAASVDALVAAIKKIGLNELWLDVFSEGVSHLGGKDGDILAEALKQTEGAGIAVYADLSLLSWGREPPEAVRDLSIEGESSQERGVHAHDRAQEPDFDEAGKEIAFVPPPVIASPMAARVREELPARVRGLSSRPGLAGFVWEDAEADNDLGYTLEMRLAFLRAFHADPVDITPELSSRGDVSLPTFDDAAADKALSGQWDKARTQANAALLGMMRQALPPSAAARPILMEQSAVRTEWLASWDDPNQLPPPLRPLFDGEFYPKPERIAAGAQKQGKLVLRREHVKDAGDMEALARALQADLGSSPANAKNGWNGFVLDFADEDATRGDHPLAELVRAAAQEDKPRSR